MKLGVNRAKDRDRFASSCSKEEKPLNTRACFEFRHSDFVLRIYT